MNFKHLKELLRPAILSVAMRSEDVRLHIGWASLLNLHAREGVEQHVKSVAKESVPMELPHHVPPHLENEL
jgi:hypothetical protein